MVATSVREIAGTLIVSLYCIRSMWGVPVVSRYVKIKLNRRSYSAGKFVDVNGEKKD